MQLSVGIGLTNDCNLRCAHCYRPLDGVYQLALEDVKAVCQALPVGGMGLGTGENALHPDFYAIVDYLRGQGIKLSMASNGYSLNAMPDEYLQAFDDLEVSIDFPSQEAQDLFRGQGNWEAVQSAMNRCRSLGIEVSILATMMNTNFDLMDQLVRLARDRGANLRVNAYQPVHNDRFSLSYEQFWEGYRRLLGKGWLVSCTEPVVAAALGLDTARSPCGHHSVRITPQRCVAPCVYWPDSALDLSDLAQLGLGILETPEFEAATRIPNVAANCPCQGGCASRRALLGALNAHDAYCPWVRGDEIDLDWEQAPAKELTRAKNYCTTIVV
jgi:MoaA/NifB/PqqE/SkfB family radical SAM enzyme